MGFPVSVVSSPNGSLGSVVAVVAPGAGAGAGVAGAAGAGAAASGLVAGAVVVCDCCARDGSGPAIVTAAAIPMQSAKRRNIKLSSVQAGACARPFSSFWLNFNPPPRGAAAAPEWPSCHWRMPAKPSYKSLTFWLYHERAGESKFRQDERSRQ